MTLESNRDQVLRRLVECLGRDRTKHQVAEVTSLGLVQMTRKRVGQGLIEAFSTTCESCGGRGIHIHSEPVNKVALDKDMDKSYSARSDYSDKPEPAEDFEPTEEISASDESASEQDEPVKKEPGKRRRRAVSTGVITPV
jgi:ribonuclease E